MITQADPFSDSSSFVAYSYSYPHKMAHRKLEPVVPLADAWRDEPRGALFLYVHLPFCESRCGFCNLFTLANADADLRDAYLCQVQRQATTIRNVLPDAQFARFAIGGGTPTCLSETQLAKLFDIAENALQARPGEIPVSCEASPTTITAGKMKLLVARGVDRISLGVQTFDDRELKQLGRVQQATEARRSIETALDAGFPTLNLDLIYGAPGQSLASWEATLQTAVGYNPAELYLYPLYIREATVLGNRGAKPCDNRIEAYRLARQLLLGHGYQQVSLRMFRSPSAPRQAGPVYCCQADGMVGLGCGARSYTRELHYSTEYAVTRQGIRAILDNFLQRDEVSFSRADHGYLLDAEDQRRRFTILGLLLTEGLPLHDYRLHFGTDVLDDLPQLGALLDNGLIERAGDRIKMTKSGIEKSDVIGPWLYSQRVKDLLETYKCR